MTSDRLIAAGRPIPAARPFDAASLPQRTAPIDDADELLELDRTVGR